jgi:uncharacterized protein
LHGKSSMYIKRSIESSVKQSLANYPVSAVIGPRQSGKSTLVCHLLKDYPDALVLDLERPSDLIKLQDAELFFESQKGRLIFLDEVQRKPELFPLIRSLVDEWGGNGHFILTGSASPELLRQSSETLAGRICYMVLYPFTIDEVSSLFSINDLLVRGGFPRSLLQKGSNVSYDWRDNFISTFLERDLAFWRGVSSSSMRRLWQMLAHHNGQTMNYSMLGKSLGLSNVSIKSYCDLLESTFMLKSLPPYRSNAGKRLVKAPKIYLTDTGIINSLLFLSSYEQVAGHPVYGSLWETMVLVHILNILPKARISHYRTSNGAELDFVIESEGKVIGIECKHSKAPKLTKGNAIAIKDVNAKLNLVLAPVNESWEMQAGVAVIPLNELRKYLTFEV